MPESKTTVPLLRWLESNNKRQVWLARQLDVSRATVSAWCAGDKKPTKHAPALQVITGLSMDDLLYFDADPLLACRIRATARQAQMSPVAA